MGKKTTITHRNDFNFKFGECYERMNYLFRLGDYFYDEDSQINKSLSKAFIGMMKEISKRNALRLDKNFRKKICEKCHNLLYKDKSTEILLKNISGKHCIEYTCGSCKSKSKVIVY